MPRDKGKNLAVAEGFEPSVGGYPTLAFEARTFGRSDTPPRTRLLQHKRRHQIAAALSQKRKAAAKGSSLKKRKVNYFSFSSFLKEPITLLTLSLIASPASEAFSFASAMT